MRKNKQEERPRRGVALFRWVIEQRKNRSEIIRTPEQQAALEELRQRNQQRGTPIVEL
jgi:hypothetical protein